MFNVMSEGKSATVLTPENVLRNFTYKLGDYLFNAGDEFVGEGAHGQPDCIPRRDYYSTLLGQLLTLVDATISDKQTNKAQKDMIRGIFRQTTATAINSISEMYKVAEEEMKKALK